MYSYFDIAEDCVKSIERRGGNANAMRILSIGQLEDPHLTFAESPGGGASQEPNSYNDTLFNPDPLNIVLRTCRPWLEPSMA